MSSEPNDFFDGHDCLNISTTSRFTDKPLYYKEMMGYWFPLGLAQKHSRDTDFNRYYIIIDKGFNCTDGTASDEAPMLVSYSKNQTFETVFDLIFSKYHDTFAGYPGKFQLAKHISEAIKNCPKNETVLFILSTYLISLPKYDGSCLNIIKKDLRKSVSNAIKNIDAVNVKW